MKKDNLLISFKSICLEDPAKKWLYTYFSTIILALFIGIATDIYWICLSPLLFWIIWQSILNFRVPYFILIACIPLSTEFHLSPTLGIDLPVEPIIIGLSFVYVFYILLFPKQSTPIHLLQNPLIYLLIIAWIWAAFTSLFSTVGVLSVKWLLAKTWYLLSCVGISLIVLSHPKSLKIFYYTLIIPLLFTVIWTLSGQFEDHFYFQLVNKSLIPFYRNHVNYGSLLALSFPIAWYGKKYIRNLPAGGALWLFSILLLLIGIYFSYARIAYVSLFVAVIAYIIIRLKAMKFTLATLSILLLMSIGYLIYENHFMRFTPDFERTTSPKDLNTLFDATFQGKDISSMERVNRWVAGARMAKSRIFTGFGPNSFYHEYKKYALADFRTYVSSNKESSTIHCYYFLLLVEQGIPGFLLFMALIFVFLIKGEKIYHQYLDKGKREIVMMTVLSQVIILVILLFNDMIETDKVGILFYTNIAILINQERAVYPPTT